MLIAIERDPGLLEREDIMGKLRLPMPLELAGLTSRMARADSQEKEIAALGRRYDKVQDDIDTAIDAHNDHVSDLEHYRDAWQSKVDSMVVKSNNPPLDDGKTDGQSGQNSSGQGQQQETVDTQTVAEGDVGKVEDVIAPEEPAAEPAASWGGQK